MLFSFDNSDYEIIAPAFFSRFNIDDTSYVRCLKYFYHFFDKALKAREELGEAYNDNPLFTDITANGITFKFNSNYNGVSVYTGKQRLQDLR